MFLVDGQIRCFGQGLKNLLLFPWPWGQDAKPTVVEDLKAVEAQEVQVFVEDDLIHLRSLLDGGHAVIRGDDDVQTVSQVMASHGLPQVADSAVDLLNDLLPVWVVGALGMTHVIGLAVV